MFVPHGRGNLLDGEGSVMFLALDIKLGVIIGDDLDSADSSGEVGSVDCRLAAIWESNPSRRD